MAARVYDAAMLRDAVVTLTLAATLLSGCAADAEWRRLDPAPSATRDGKVVAPEAGVQFTLPSGWRLLTGIGSDGWTEESKKAAGDLMGISPEDVVAYAAQLDLVARGPDSTLNVNTVHDTTTLPTREDLLSIFQPGLGLTVRDVRPVSTPLGDSTVVRYDAEVMGRPVQGESLYVAVDDHVVNITVTTLSPGQAGRAMTRIIATLGRS